MVGAHEGASGKRYVLDCDAGVHWRHMSLQVLLQLLRWQLQLTVGTPRAV